VNAGRDFKKGQPKNYIPDEGIRKISDAFIKGKEIEKLLKVISNEEAAENDYNLSPSRYVDITEKETYRPIPEILEDLDGLEKRAGEIDADLQEIFKKLGFRQ
jgi:type I restriction enzyme M protein